MNKSQTIDKLAELEAKREDVQKLYDTTGAWKLRYRWGLLQEIESLTFSIVALRERLARWQ